MTMMAASQVLARDVAELVAALKACTAACVIALSPGDWRGVRIDRVQTHATISGQEAVLHDLRIANSSGITLSNLELSTASAPSGNGSGGGDYRFQVLNASNITFDRLRVHGDPRGTLQDTPSGLMIVGSSNVTVKNSDFTRLHHAIVFTNDSNIVLQKNAFHELYDDAMRGAEIHGLRIDGNACYSNHPDLSDQDHPDCIQMWTARANSSSNNITITNNTFDRGSGHATQFIFLGNESNLPYLNVVISGNKSYGALWNGLAITNGRDITIADNQIMPSCRPDNGQMISSWVVTGAIQNLTIANNVAGKFAERSLNPGKSQYNNRISGCMDHSPF